MATHGMIQWNELNTHNSDAARTFYGAVLGWTFDAMPMEDGSSYWIIKSGDRIVGGIFEMMSPAFAGIPEHWFTHIAVDDIEKRVQAVRNSGGTITRAPFVVPGVGTLAVLKAASGSYCAFVQPESLENVPRDIFAP